MEDQESAPAWARWSVSIVTLSAFGPYVASGIRTEQVAVYATTLAVLVLGAGRVLRLGARAPFQFIGIWGALATVEIVGGLIPPVNLTPFPSGHLLAGIDNVLLPLAMMVLCSSWGAVSPVRPLLLSAARIVVIMMGANAALACMAWMGGYGGLGWLSHFWGQEDDASITVARSVSMGRYPGIFTQPTEGGIAYSLAIFCLIYLVREEGRIRGFLSVALGGLLVVGGVLTASKVFVLGGIPLVAAVVLADRRRRKRILWSASFLGCISLVVLLGGSLPNWSGLAVIQRVFSPESGSAIDAVSSGRLGSGGTLSGPSSQILAHHPFFGLGAGGLDVPYDSTWLEGLAVSGLVGTALLVVIHLMLVVRWLSIRGCFDSNEWLLSGAVLIMVIAASFGMPSLTGNRIATLVWIFLGLLIVNRAKEVPVGRSGKALTVGARRHSYSG